ncbi:MAG: hypothetical protein WBG76_01105 [Ornithinimicrobium sp.]
MTPVDRVVTAVEGLIESFARSRSAIDLAGRLDGDVSAVESGGWVVDIPDGPLARLVVDDWTSASVAVLVIELRDREIDVGALRAGLALEEFQPLPGGVASRGSEATVNGVVMTVGLLSGHDRAHRLSLTRFEP